MLNVVILMGFLKFYYVILIEMIVIVFGRKNNGDFVSLGFWMNNK